MTAQPGGEFSIASTLCTQHPITMLPRFFKYYRLAALYKVVKNLQDADRVARIRNESLALAALAIYQINALIYRPADGRAEYALLEAACQHLPDKTGDSVTRPTLYSRGAYFLSDIMNEGIYCLPTVRPIGPTILAALYQRDNLADIEAEFNDRETDDEMAVAASKPRKHKTTLELADDSDSDYEISSVGEVPTAAIVEDPDVKNTIRKIMRQFPSDIFQLGPKRRVTEGSPWILLDREDAMNINIDMFQSLDFRMVFRQVQCQIVKPEFWYEQVFGRYFPQKGAARMIGLQHFPSATYYRLWGVLMSELDKESTEAIRKRLFCWFDEFLWVPYPDSDRMWSTKMMCGIVWFRLPMGEPQPCPALAINPRHHSSVVAVAHSLREEEEEEEEEENEGMKEGEKWKQMQEEEEEEEEEESSYISPFDCDMIWQA